MKKQILFALFLLGCLSLPAQRLVLPDMPDENITGFFQESPMTWQVKKFSDTMSLKGFQIAWSTAQNQWGDTLRSVEQHFEASITGEKFIEISRQKQSDDKWTSDRKIEVFNPLNWYLVEKPIPDSVYFYIWDKAGNKWSLKQKIIYEKDVAGNELQRSVFLTKFQVADTLETFKFDHYWDALYRKRMVYNPQTEQYTLLDTMRYFFPDTTVCYNYVIVKTDSNQTASDRRYIFKYFNDKDTYEINISRRDTLFGEIIWRFIGRIVHISDSIDFRVVREYSTLTSMDLQTSKRLIWQYDSIWVPKRIEMKYFPSLSGAPDSTIQKDYIKDDSTGFIRSIVEQFKTEVEDFRNRTKWEFAPGKKQTVSAQEPVRVEAVPLRVSRLSAKSFQLDFDPMMEIQSSHLRLFDVNGRNLKDWSVNQSSANIDLSNFSAGMYYLHITTARGSRTVPLVVTE